MCTYRPVASLVSNGARFGVYQAQGNTYYQGPASPENVSRFLPVVLPSEELVAVMLGQVPFIPAERKTLELDRDKGVYVRPIGDALAFCPPLIAQKKHLDQMFGTVAEVLKDLA